MKLGHHDLSEKHGASKLDEVYLLELVSFEALVHESFQIEL